jgi:ligand-binding sensor protein
LKNAADSEIEIYSFSELVDVETFTNLLEAHALTTGIPNSLFGLDGELISQAGWCDACKFFHRANPETKQLCKKSNLELIQNLEEGKITSRLCENGLYDYATPILVEGHHLATLFLGQVFHTPPDIKYFSQQAKQFNFDLEKYLDAVCAVPIINKNQMEAHIQAMASVTQILANNGLARLKKTRLKCDLNKSAKQRIQFQDLLQFLSELDGQILTAILNISTISSPSFSDTLLKTYQTWKPGITKHTQIQGTGKWSSNHGDNV